MKQILKHILVRGIPALLVLSAAGCGKSASETAEAVSKPEETAAQPAAAPAAEVSAAGKYNALGLIMGQYVVEVDSMKGNYLELKDDGSGYLYFGADNQGDISSWEETNGAFTMKAGVSEFTGELKDGILDLELGDEFVVKFAKDGIDTSAFKIVTMEEYRDLAAKEAGSKDENKSIAGFYYAYAVESGDMCILLPEEDRNSFAFTINDDGTGKVHVDDESEDTLWKLDGDVLTFYELSGEPATADYDITWNDGIITIAVPPDEDNDQVIYEYLVREGADTLKIDMRAVKPE
ncbi:MAG: hypothetical protein IIZ10_10595 [Solobacterium sp.]|nr:hypothetical protein [Solobacterium sp.]